MSEQIEVDESEFDDFQVEEPTEIEPTEEPEVEAEEPVAEAEVDEQEPKTQPEDPFDEEKSKNEDPYKNIDFNDTQQKFIKDRITDPLIGRRKQVEEENRYLKAVLKAAGIDNVPKLPDLPPKPDAFDPDFDQKMEERDKIMRERERYAVRQEAFNEREQERIQQSINQRDAKYFQNAAEQGLKEAEIRSAGDKVLAAFSSENPNIVQQNVSKIDYIMRRADGPKITAYLGKNPVALQTIANMEFPAAIETIATKIAPFLEGKVKVEAEDPPEPTEQLKGRGASKLSAIDQEIADLGVEVE